MDITQIFPENSPYSYLVSALLYCVILLITHSGRKKSNGLELASWFLCALFVLFAFWGGDYYHYSDVMTMMRHSTFDFMENRNQVHMETPYWILAQFINYDYLKFRFIIWCGSIIILFSICRILSLNSYYFLYYFVSVALLSFSGSRVCLVEALALLGWFIFVNHWMKKGDFLGLSFIYFIIAIALICFASIFHKSSYFFVAVLLVAFFDIDKKRLKLLLILFPVFAMVVSSFVIPFIQGADTTEAGLVNFNSAQGYLNQGVVSYGIPTWISVILGFLLDGYIAIFLYNSVKNGEYSKWPVVIRKTANIVLYTFVFSVPFAFTAATYSMFYRFIAFMLVPTAFLLALLRQYGITNKYTNRIVILSLISIFYTLGLGLLSKLLA